MRQTIPALEARERLLDLVAQVRHGGSEFALEQDGAVVALLVAPPARDQMLAMMDAVHERTKDIPQEVLEVEIAEAFKAVRSGAWPPRD